jgi:hypothetical protein
MVAVRQVKTRPVDGLTPAPRFPRPVQSVAIAARLCRPDFFSMTSGIKLRDGDLPRRSGARTAPGTRRPQGHYRARRWRCVGAGEAMARRDADPRAGAGASAHRWKRVLEECRYRSAGELAEAEGVTRSFVNRLLRLTLLAPDIVEPILDGRQAKGLQLVELTGRLPSTWAAQRQLLPTTFARSA